jgi:hypothetical protein
MGKMPLPSQERKPFSTGKTWGINLTIYQLVLGLMDSEEEECSNIQKYGKT